MRKTTWMLIAGLVIVTMAGSGCVSRKKYNALKLALDNTEGYYQSTLAQLDDCESANGAIKDKLNSARLKLQQKQATPKVTPNLNGGGKYDPNRGTITVTLASDVLFDSGKATIKSTRKLANIASAIKRQYPNKEVWVIGHTDSDPIKKSKWKDNWDLSTARARSVVLSLVKQGVSAKQIVAAGRGQYLPVGSSKASNRRVEIIVYTR